MPVDKFQEEVTLGVYTAPRVNIPKPATAARLTSRAPAPLRTTQPVMCGIDITGNILQCSWVSPRTYPGK
jgi:hypothetical protein